MIKRILSMVLMMALPITAFAACGKTDGESKDSENAKTETTAPVKVAIEVKDFGTMTLELYPDKAPITVENFLAYVNDGFYNGLTFHRIYKGFMIQGGDPKGDGTGNGNRPAIKGEFSSNGVNNDLSHKRGVISMARTNVNDSATSQFFICDADSTFLDGNYAAFGMMTDGFDVLDAIASTEVKSNLYGEKSTTPIDPPVIERIYVVEN